uniref:Uncharacterized protein n=1 Tax=Chlamydomonas euryale TaxID=1486919 RepID=A0A7R9YRE0_9CHLO
MLALWARCPEYAHSSHRHPNFAPHGAHVLLVAQATRLQLWKRSLKKHRLMCPHNIYFLKITLQAFMLATADLDLSDGMMEPSSFNTVSKCFRYMSKWRSVSPL